jgi:hypothetical protein
MTAPIGSLIYLQSVQANLHVYAVVTDGATPNLNRITITVNADEATAIVPGLVGKTGPQGAPQYALKIQPDVYNNPSQLPSVANGNPLTNSPTDFGKYWLVETLDVNGNIVGANAYVWWGTNYRVLPFGTVGPTGPVPVITPEVILIDPDQQSWFENTGTISNPQWTFFIACPPGPPGPTATLASCPDVDERTPPTIGQVLGFNGIYSQGLPVFQPMTIGAMNPMPYTVPESSFQAYSGVATANHTVCTFPVPANPWPWKPLVWGHVQLADSLGIWFGNNVVGVEVRLGDPQSGQLIAAGYGNAVGATVTITPQTSLPATSQNTTGASTAMTPNNAVGLVRANHTGNEGTIYVNLKSAGMASQIKFAPDNNQLFILACPVTTIGPVTTAIYGPLSSSVSISAWSIVVG